MNRRLPARFRPLVELLETRLTPAGNVTTSLVNGNLTITGDFFANDISISQTAVGQLTITGIGTTVNGGPGPININGVLGDVNIKLGTGNDTFTFNEATSITLLGNLNFIWGNGSKTVNVTGATNATKLTVAQNINDNYAAGVESTQFTNLNVFGSLNITSLVGTTSTTIATTAGSVFNNLGSLNITNGTGTDTNTIRNTKITGAATINNGAPNILGGTTTNSFVAAAGATSRSKVGSLSITNPSGRFQNNILGYDVGGSATISDGGTGNTAIDSSNAPGQPSFGSLTVTDTGSGTISIGVTGSGLGLKDNGAFNLSTGGGGTDTLNRLLVASTSTIGVGGRATTFNIRNSNFASDLTMTFGDGGNILNIQTVAGTTNFFGAVNVVFGAGGDTLNLAFPGGREGGPVVNLFGAATFDGGGGLNFGNLGIIGVNVKFFGSIPVLMNFI